MIWDVALGVFVGYWLIALSGAVLGTLNAMFK